MSSTFDLDSSISCFFSSETSAWSCALTAIDRVSNVLVTASQLIYFKHVTRTILELVVELLLHRFDVLADFSFSRGGL